MAGKPTDNRGNNGANNNDTAGDDDNGGSEPPANVIIVGGGIAGLVLALSLHRHCGLEPEIYEAASSFEDGIGGAISLYPNGLRVIRDISPKLLSRLRWEGFPHVWRRWYRHDGTEVARARESELTPTKREGDVLNPLAIRRWRLQRALYEACMERGICVKFSMRVLRAIWLDDGTVKCVFADGTSRRTRLLFGADGVDSAVREAVVGPDVRRPEYTGVTCLMGAASIPCPRRGVCLPSSLTTRCHMSMFPTGEGDTVFEIYFPTPVENPESWGKLTPSRAHRECSELADRFQKDGWNDQFVRPLREVDLNSVQRVGLRSRRQPLPKWVEGRMVLLGDAAHPALPYLGQGAQMAMVDAGTLVLLLRHFCFREEVDDPRSRRSNLGSKGGGDDEEEDRCGPAGKFSFGDVDEALEVYQRMRIPRTAVMLEKIHFMGRAHQGRADSALYSAFREATIRIGIWWNGTLPILRTLAMYDYRAEVERVLEEEGGKDRACRC